MASRPMSVPTPNAALVEEIAITPANIDDGKACPDALPDNPGEMLAYSRQPFWRRGACQGWDVTHRRRRYVETG
ncbi:hypothetical protein [Mesorhizobium sp. M0013]|uniref:hypothetical protein n=1 Tax=Mesorhizobium sp. M0013 TaxID=2956841 RepID=UPI003335008F